MLFFFVLQLWPWRDTDVSVVPSVTRCFLPIITTCNFVLIVPYVIYFYPEWTACGVSLPAKSLSAGRQPNYLQP